MTSLSCFLSVLVMNMKERTTQLVIYFCVARKIVAVDIGDASHD